MSSWPSLPQHQDDYGFSNSYGQNTDNQQASRSTQQSYSTAYTPAQTPYYRLQATAAAAADYSNEGYQSQTYGQRQPQQQQQPQQRPTNNESLDYSSQWYGANGASSRTAASSGNDTLANSTNMSQAPTSNSTLGATGGGHGNRVYDTTGFENLVYASTAVGYATESTREQPRNQEASNTGNHYGSRTLPAVSNAQAPYTQAYPQPSTATTNAPQYNNTYAPQITRPASTDSSASQSTSYSQRQTPVLTQQAVQNPRPASRTNAPYSQQQAPSHGVQPARSTTTPASNGYTPRQTPTAAARDRVAQAARAYAQQQAYYKNTQNTMSNSANLGTSISQSQPVGAPSQRQSPNIMNQRQVPTAAPSQRQTQTNNSHQRVPSVNSNTAKSSPTFPQRHVSAATHQAPSTSTSLEARSNSASPLYRTSNTTPQPGQHMKSNLSNQSVNFLQQQSQSPNHQMTQNKTNPTTPQPSANVQSQQSFSASNQSRNPRSLLSPTEASAQASQTRNTVTNRQDEAPTSQMQTVIDPRDLDLRPRPSPSAILEAARLMREAEEKHAAAEAAAKERAQSISTGTLVPGREAAQGAQSSKDANTDNARGVSLNNQPRDTPRATIDPSSSVRQPASPQISRPGGRSSNSTAPSQASQPAASPKNPSKPKQNNNNPVPAPRPSAPKRNPVVWPESKKASLAAAAITVLKSFPENGDKTITKEQIHAMLDEGPSYIEFCEMIEGMKFKMDRARLAKTLLSAVSDGSAATAQSTSQASSTPRNSGQRKQNASAHPANSASQRKGQPPIDPQILAHSDQNRSHQNPGQGAVVSLAEPSVGPNGQSQIQWRPLNNANNTGSGNASTSGEVPKKKRPHRKSAPELGPDGQPIPPRPRGRPRRDGLPPIPRKSMPATNNEDSMDSPSVTNAHQLSAFAYQASPSMSRPNEPRSGLVHQQEAPEASSDDWRARHAKALRDRWDSMDDRPNNFPYPSTESPMISPSRDDVERRLLEALGNENQSKGTTEDVNRLYGSNTTQTQGARGQPLHDLHLSAPSSSNKRNATNKATLHAQQNPNHSTSQQQQQEKQHQPLTKEMAARKRNFSELIDLTGDTDSSDAPSPHKFRRVEENATADENYINYGDRQAPRTILPNLESHGHAHPPLLPAPQRVYNNGVEQFIAPGFNRQQYELGGSSSPQISSRNSPNPYEHFDDLCKPIDKNLALRKSEYNPKTIARDVLIAVSRHPTERAINAHLEILKKRFPKQVNNRSDLSTFRWDIVDPGGLPVGSANMPTNDSQKPGDKNQGESAGGASDYRSPYNPLPGTVAAFKRPTNTTPARPSHLRHEASGPSGIASASPRRGRPPKDRSGDSSKGANSVREGSTANSTPRKRGRPFKSAESALRAAVKQQRLSTGELQPGRRGRPPKALIDPTKLSDPKYVSFDCEWKDCKAELQNLDTLRQHIFTVHNHPQPSGGISCQWINCGKDETVTDPETQESRIVHHDLILTDMEKFKKHIEKKHMPAYAWNLGDGPKGSDLDGNESDVSYLSDANGRQVTPSVANQEVVPEHRNRSTSLTVTVNKNGEPRKKVGRPSKNKTVEEPDSERIIDDASRDSSVAAGSA